MEIIKIDVTGNSAKVTDRPAIITSGTVGLPVEFTFDSQWDGLSKTAVFMAGCVQINEEGVKTNATVPWEVLATPGLWLSIGVYGVNEDGTIAIPTIWANVCPIQVGASPDGDPGTDPALPVWQKLLNAIGDLNALDTKATHDLVAAINDAYDMAKNGGLNTDDTLTIEGNAADAKATGDAIADAKTIAENAQTAIENEVIAREQAVAKEAYDRGSSFFLLDKHISSHEIDHSNPHGVTRKQIGAAPSGYGLGEAVVGELSSSDMDDVSLGTGWYRITEYDYIPIQEMRESAEALLRVEHMRTEYRDGDFVIQTLYLDCQEYMLEVRRMHYNASTAGYAWSAWEYVNPQMVANVEYRTTQVWEGKPVYRKLANLGSVSNGATVVWHNESNIIPLKYDSHFYAQTVPKYENASAFFFVNVVANKAIISSAGWTAQPVSITVDYVYPRG